MLHLLFPQLADHLRTAVPTLGTIDLDMAQLDYLDGPEPIQYPAVFIDVEDVPWSDLGEGIQSGRAVLRFTVAVDVSEVTYQGSQQRSDAMEKLEVVQLVHKALQHHQGEGFGPLVRTAYRRDRPQHPEAWCIALGYVTQLYDHDGAKEYTEASDVGLQAQPGMRPPVLADGEAYILP
ncbi:hypothetical protein LJ737_19830 [Hymenobacter sp. 15J16-1T3B]|uniref:hypothetical protein n=1 Tax=Hymenobacter sp. 15J16-1T3B TaxID=2886941 RepID=UPI001D12C6FC|nr:hypothetical protein [Hymenobacter sp. 15J16-1T3B]MCC3159502.1 hypothetical protein [Hymenobacter sp. 15J16-1T3B]